MGPWLRVHLDLLHLEILQSWIHSNICPLTRLVPWKSHFLLRTRVSPLSLVPGLTNISLYLWRKWSLFFSFYFSSLFRLITHSSDTIFHQLLLSPEIQIGGISKWQKQALSPKGTIAGDSSLMKLFLLTAPGSLQSPWTKGSYLIQPIQP